MGIYTDKLTRNQYYILTAFVSIFALFFLPLAGSSAGLAWNLPNTAAGWIVFVTTRLMVAAINMLIFHCFVQQGRLNVANNENYKNALKLYDTLKNNKTLKSPRSPSEYYKEIYGKKGVLVFIGSAGSALALTQAVLTFDWMSMLTYLFTIIMGVVFGILQMKDSEMFWTSEFPRFINQISQQGEQSE